MVRSRNRAQAERTRATRSRIVDAATSLFVRDGYLETTMSGIAKAAGVAVQTLYLSFGSKVAVLEAALVAATEGHPPPGTGRPRPTARPRSPSTSATAPRRSSGSTRWPPRCGRPQPTRSRPSCSTAPAPPRWSSTPG